MIVLVLGMHRSGTSALAGMLHDNGIVMGRHGEFHPPPMKENPKGFFENRRFRTINDMILRKYSYNVKSFSPYIPNVHAVQGNGRYEMKELILGYNDEFENWGWKDPRTCLTLYAWLDILGELDLIKSLKVLHIFRSYEEVSLSMRTRGNKEGFPHQFSQLAEKYHSTAMRHMAAFNNKVQALTIHFRDLITDPDEAAGHINGFLGKPLVTNTSFVDPAIPKNVNGVTVRRRDRRHEPFRTHRGTDTV